MARTPKTYVHLTPEQDKQLQTLELNPNINATVRLRASILRLSNQGFSVLKLSQHFNRHKQSIHNDFKRWTELGLQGLTNGKTTGRPAHFTPEIESFIRQKLSEDRIWNAQLLCDEVQQSLNVKLSREPMRLKLLEMGFSWKRARYSSGKPPTKEVVLEHRANLETLKKGLWKSV
jgi:transposase